MCACTHDFNTLACMRVPLRMLSAGARIISHYANHGRTYRAIGPAFGISVDGRGGGNVPR